MTFLRLLSVDISNSGSNLVYNYINVSKMGIFVAFCTPL